MCQLNCASIFVPAFLIGLAGVAPAQTSPADTPARVISVDFTKVRGPHSTVWKECIGAGRANEGLRADWQEQLATSSAYCASFERGVGFSRLQPALPQYVATETRSTVGSARKFNP